MSIICVGDIHAKNKEPYRSSINNFFKDLLDNYKDETIIFLGDLFDSSSPHKEIESEIISHLKKLYKVFILTGNHDYSKRMGNSLDPLDEFENISIIKEVTELNIEDMKCLFLPFKYTDMKEEYEELEGFYDLIFTHITPPECAFGDEGINLKLKCRYFVHGHTHIQKDFKTKDSIHHVLGVPIATRHGEDKQDFRMMEITDKNKYRFIHVEKYFEYEEVIFGNDPKSRNNILNIVDAPDIKSVFDRYKDYYIREEGIKIKNENNTDGDENKFEIDFNSIKQLYIDYCNDNNISRSIITKGLKYMDNI